MAGLTTRARLTGVCLLGVVVCSFPLHSAFAQINPFRNYSGPVLSKQDLAEGRQAAARLLDAPSPQVGTSEAWTNAASGNSGKLTIERIYQRNGNDCRAVRSLVHYKNGRERSLLLQACHVGGRWRLAS